MSRTYRHRHENDTSSFFTDYFWILKEWDCSPLREGYSNSCRKVYTDPNSKEGKKKLAMFRAKPYRTTKGPGWWINQFVQKPYRRESKAKLKKFLKDSDYEVIIESKPSRPWWD